MIMDSISRRAFAPRAKFAAISTISCAMVRSNSASRSATSVAKGRRRRFMARWRPASCGVSCRKSLQPADLLRQLNQLLCERTVEGRFMTMCFATWQRNRQKLRVANAGQSQPLLWKDGRCEKLDLNGFPLGLYVEATYDEMSFTLAAGNVLVFHSDGLAESNSPDGQFFGTDRLIDLIAANHERSAGEIADLLLSEVERFTGNAPLSDDRTLVVLKVK